MTNASTFDSTFVDVVCRQLFRGIDQTSSANNGIVLFFVPLNTLGYLAAPNSRNLTPLRFNLVQIRMVL